MAYTPPATALACAQAQCEALDLIALLQYQDKYGTAETATHIEAIKASADVTVTTIAARFGVTW